MNKRCLLLTALAIVLITVIVPAILKMSVSNPGLSTSNTSDHNDNGEASGIPEAYGGTGGPAYKLINGPSNVVMAEDEKWTEDDAAEKVRVIFNEGPIVLKEMDPDRKINLIVEEKETFKIDPELAERLRKDAGEAKQPLTGLFRTTMTVMQTGEAVELDFSIENISGEDQEYCSGSSQMYDFYVCNSDGSEVYRWSDNMDFAAVITETRLKKGESRSFTETWDYVGSDGRRVPPGEYLITVEIIAEMDNGKVIDADELTAKEHITVD